MSECNHCAALFCKIYHAYGCYFHLKSQGEDLKLSFPRFVDRGIYIWDIHRSKGAFRHPDGIHTAFYEQKALIEDLRALEFNDFSSLVEAWHKQPPLSRRGLLFCDAPHSEF